MAFDEERGAQRLAGVFSALSHPRRLIILDCLLRRERTVSDLVRCERLAPCSQGNVSQHLAILRSMGVVRVRRVGNRSYYRIAAGHLERLLTEGKRVLAEAK